jgi:ADP-ribose pyrophosphatase YjhB (NUDIX family)
MAMTESNNKTVIRCRAIIVHNGRLLVVKHQKTNEYYALPGGHLEWGEDIIEAIKREVVEELGIEPKVGRLLYVHNLIQPEKESLPAKQSIEFFFEIKNGHYYQDTSKLGGSHKDELAEIIWLEKNSMEVLMPGKVQADLNNGTIFSDIVRFI